MGALIAAGVIAAAGAVYAGYSSNKASKEAANSLNGMQQLNLDTLPPPETVDWKSVLRGTIGQNYENLPMDFALANKVNDFQSNQFLRGVSKIQPYFKQNQELIGRNVASFARGELPSDTIGSIGRAAASRGLESGIGLGAGGGGPGTALGGLNLRNLGLQSLDLAKFGTGAAMQANTNAANMLPNLFDPASMFISPNAALGVESNNANIINDWNKTNIGIKNAEATGNTELLNKILEEQTGLKIQGKLAQAQAVQSASSSVAGIAGGMGGGGAGAAAGGAGGGWQSSAAGARGRAAI